MKKKSKISEIDPNFKVAGGGAPDGLCWHDAAAGEFAVRGLPWFKENVPAQGQYSRFPPRAQKLLRPEVWELARCTAGVRICFQTDSPRMVIRVTNEHVVVMSHMPASGSGGLALYVGEPGRMRPCRGVIPEQQATTFERELLVNLPRALREYMLYLPLYNICRKLEIGLAPGSEIRPPTPPAIAKPVVFYGTSITQGGCASLPCSDYVATIGRRLNLDVINLGFSGNGRGEPEVATLMSEVDAALYVLAYSENVSAAELAQTLPRFVAILRERHPITPILLLTQLPFWNGFAAPEQVPPGEDRRDVMLAQYVNLRQAGDRYLHLADGYGMMPPQTDATYVDGCHPTDHGFQVMAERLAPMIARLLE